MAERAGLLLAASLLGLTLLLGLQRPGAQPVPGPVPVPYPPLPRRCCGSCQNCGCA